MDTCTSTLSTPSLAENAHYSSSTGNASDIMSVPFNLESIVVAGVYLRYFLWPGTMNRPLVLVRSLPILCQTLVVGMRVTDCFASQGEAVYWLSGQPVSSQRCACVHACVRDTSPRYMDSRHVIIIRIII